MSYSPLCGMVMPFSASIDPETYCLRDTQGGLDWCFAPDATNNTGWILCDGSTFYQSIFPRLFQLLGDWYGGSAGEGLGAVPDYRGYFFRMVAANSSQDPGLDASNAADQRCPSTNGQANDVGSTQVCMVQNHAHLYDQVTNGATFYVGAASTQYTNSPRTINSQAQVGDQVEGQVTLPCGSTPVDLSGTESRPRNIYVNYLIYAG